MPVDFLSIAKAMAYHHAIACISSPKAYIISRRLYFFRNDDIQHFVLMIYNSFGIDDIQGFALMGKSNINYLRASCKYRQGNNNARKFRFLSPFTLPQKFDKPMLVEFFIQAASLRLDDSLSFASRKNRLLSISRSEQDAAEKRYRDSRCSAPTYRLLALIRR